MVGKIVRGVLVALQLLVVQVLVLGEARVEGESCSDRKMFYPRVLMRSADWVTGCAHEVSAELEKWDCPFHSD